MKKLKELLKTALDNPIAGGHEKACADRLGLALSRYFQDLTVEKNGNIIIRIKAEGKPKLLIDAHADRIAMLITDIKDGGFLTVTGVGGIDKRVLQASDVTVLANSPFDAIISSTPPHLTSGDDKLKPIDELLIDTGIEKSVLEKAIKIGMPVIFKNSLKELENGVVSSPALDNSVCVAAISDAALNADMTALAYDTYLLLSVREELGGFAGIRTAIEKIKPEIVITTDVNFAKAPNVPEEISITRGSGFSLSLSALTDIPLSRRISEFALKNGIPCQTVVEADDLGTNGNFAAISAAGATALNMSIPETNMHSTHETASLYDMKALSAVLTAVMEGKI